MDGVGPGIPELGWDGGKGSGSGTHVAEGVGAAQRGFKFAIKTALVLEGFLTELLKLRRGTRRVLLCFSNYPVTHQK